jgi:hypothetical protein
MLNSIVYCRVHVQYVKVLYIIIIIIIITILIFINIIIYIMKYILQYISTNTHEQFLSDAHQMTLKSNWMNKDGAKS